MPLLFLITMMFGQCASDEETVEGGLSLFGAEPFVQLAVITDDDERIFLDAEQELLDSLWTENHGRIIIRGNKYEGEWYGQPHAYIKVSEWKWAED